MGKQQLFGGVTLERHHLAQGGRQLLIGKLHLVSEDGLGRIFLVRDDAGPDVLAEQGAVQEEDTNQRGEAELTGLENDVAAVHALEQAPLGPVRLERHDQRIVAIVVVVPLHHDFVEHPRADAPHGVGQAHSQVSSRGWHEIVRHRH